MERLRVFKYVLGLFILLNTPNYLLSKNQQSKTWRQLVQVNKNWNDVNPTFKLIHHYEPNSEKELVKLHLLNVLSYLETKNTNNLTNEQQTNRELNLHFLREYISSETFPINNITSYRTPIFIDDKGTYCAVGYLMKRNGLQNVAIEISENQLLAYLPDIKHKKLNEWQLSCGLSFFELSLIQPTYGPATPICAAPSPIEWDNLETNNLNIKRLYNTGNKNSFYAIVNTDDYSFNQKIKKYTLKNEIWEDIGPTIEGEIQEIVLCDDNLYLSAFLPNEAFPHQILKLKNNKWVKMAHFDANITSITSFKNKIYVLGNFKTVNDSIASSLVVIENEKIGLFKPKSKPYSSPSQFDHLVSSNTALFLLNNGAIYRFKNDSIHYLTSIQYYQYIYNIGIDAIEDTLFVSSKNIQGYNKYFNAREHSFYIQNEFYGQDYPYNTINYTKSKMINGKMMIAGDFKTSTRIPQINDNSHIIKCDQSNSSHWYGEGLIYAHGYSGYPILEKGIILDFIQVNNQIYALKNDGNLIYTNLGMIEDKIKELAKIRLENKQNEQLYQEK